MKKKNWRETFRNKNWESVLHSHVHSLFRKMFIALKFLCGFLHVATIYVPFLWLFCSSQTGKHLWWDEQKSEHRNLCHPRKFNFFLSSLLLSLLEAPVMLLTLEIPFLTQYTKFPIKSKLNPSLCTAKISIGTELHHICIWPLTTFCYWPHQYTYHCLQWCWLDIFLPS